MSGSFIKCRCLREHLHTCALPPTGKEKSSSWFTHPVENYTFEQVLKYAFNLTKPANKPSLSSSSASSSPLEPGIPAAVPWHDIYIHNLPLSPTNPAQVRQQVRLAPSCSLARHLHSQLTLEPNQSGPSQATGKIDLAVFSRS